jgi:hypothetical protein
VLRSQHASNRSTCSGGSDFGKCDNRQSAISDEISLDQSALQQKTQKGAQCCDRQFSAVATDTSGFTKDEAMHVMRSQILKTQRLYV